MSSRSLRSSPIRCIVPQPHAQSRLVGSITSSVRGEFFRQIALVVPDGLGSPRTGRGRGVLILLRLDFGDGSFQVFEGQLPLVLAEPLELRTMYDLVQLGNETLEALVGFHECIALTPYG